ncbi:MAG: hypothetical protein J7502_16710 [Flavisolibacter sp.]|nr:hypothetical protein [Flavisolibacter sp.]
MARTKQNISNEQRKADFEKELKHKYSSIKTSFEAGKLENFDQIDAIIRPSVLAKQLHMGYKSFKSKSESPGDFSNNELVRMADLFDIDINLLLKMVFKLMRFKNRFKAGDSIRL